MTTYIPNSTKTKQLTGSRKRQCTFSPGHTSVNVNSYWDGGSKSSYVVFNIDSGMEVLPVGNAPFMTSGRLDYTLIIGDIVIETGTFCGKPATPRFMCRTEDSERVLTFLTK